MTQVFNKIRAILHKNCSLQFEDIQPEARFEVELAVDSSEMIELIGDFEEIFKITIDYDDIDNFVFDRKNSKMTIQDAVNYIESRLRENNNNSLF